MNKKTPSGRTANDNAPHQSVGVATAATIIRRIRCGHLEAIIGSVAMDANTPRYGVFFQRTADAGPLRSSPLFVFGELLTLAKLAQLAHAALIPLITESSPPDEQ